MSVQSDIAQVEPVSAPKRRSAPPRERRWSIEVLLVDDDAADASLILDVLKRDPRVGSAQTSDQPEAVLYQLANGRTRPNLILLDINMPKLSGFKFLTALRQIPTMRDTPVVFLTTSRFARDVEQAKASSAELYVVKPDSYDELKARLGAVLECAVSGAWS